jgi:hypothetical protein
MFGNAAAAAFPKILNFFFIKIEYGLYVLDHFDVLMSKMIFKKWKNIIGMHFSMKSYLKRTRNHTAKHVLNIFLNLKSFWFIFIINYLWKQFLS